MLFFVKYEQKTSILYGFRESDTIRTLLLVISNKYSLPIEVFYLIYGGKLLSSKNTINASKLEHESTIRVIIRAGSGAPIVFK